MAGLRGANSFLVARYIVFGLFAICNAITCSVAVWNYSLVRTTQPAQVDIYIIFLGAFSLVSIFTLIFVELLCTNAFTTHVWFECAWLTLFWTMQLAGGAALIVIESNMSCWHGNTTFLKALCTSERVLLAFTWICAATLLVYLLVLVFIAASQNREEVKIWRSDVRKLRAVALRRCSPSAPNSPLTTRFKKRPSVDIYTSHPPRPQPVQTFPFPYHKGLSVDYEVEPFRPAFVSPEQMEIPPSSHLPEAIPLPPLAAGPIIPPFLKPIPALPRDTMNTRSLSLNQIDVPRELVSTIEYANPGRQPLGPVAGQSTSLPSPSPLGDWPRRDAMQLPAKPNSKRKPPPPSAFEFPKRQTVSMASSGRASVPADTVTPRPRRPSGPRLKIPSGENGHGPAPLDLSGISNYEAGRRDGLNV